MCIFLKIMSDIMYSFRVMRYPNIWILEYNWYKTIQVTILANPRTCPGGHFSKGIFKSFIPDEISIHCTGSNRGYQQDFTFY
jgi:hypothetical protein